MIPVDLTYGLPAALYLLPVSLLLIFFFWLLYRYRARAEKTLGNPDILSVILRPRSRFIYLMKAVAVFFLWISGVMALMDPQGNARYPEEIMKQHATPAEVTKPAHDVFLLVDASASMDVKDSRDGSSRLDYAKDIADQIVSQLEGQNVSLLAFTSTLTQLSPLTLDYLFVRLMINQMEINEGNITGTDLKSTFSELNTRYFPNTLPRQRTLILISDGGDTLYETLEGQKKIQRKKEILNLLDTLQSNRVQTFVVGMGSREGGTVPHIIYQGQPVHSFKEEAFLKQIASHGRGNFYEANVYSAIEIAEDLLKNTRQQNNYLEQIVLPTQSRHFKVYDYYYQIPLGIAIVLLLFTLFFPEAKKGVSVLCFLLIPTFTNAQTIEDNLQNASLFYEAQDYPHALEIYKDLLNLPLTSWQQAVVLYNLGSVYLASGENLKALVLYISLQKQKGLPNLFMRELKIAQAIAFLKESRNIKGNSFDTLDEKYFYLTESLDAIYSATQFDCKIQNEEEKVPCKVPGDLFLMEQVVAQYFSELHKDVQQLESKLTAEKIKDPINKLLLAYRKLLLEEQITPSSLSQLLKQQENSEPTSKTSLEWLNKSLEQLKLNPIRARLYLLKAFQELVMLKRSKDTDTLISPSEILDAVIEYQREALQMSRLIYKIQERETHFSFENPQTTVLQTATSFFPAVKNYQLQQFVEGKSLEECCQARPWDEVLPLFNRGWQEAKEASSMKGLDVIIGQRQALSSWLEAKAKLKSPKQPFSGSCFGKNKKSSSQENETQQQPFQQIARELEKMSKEDRVLQPTKNQPAPVERPW